MQIDKETRKITGAEVESFDSVLNAVLELQAGAFIWCLRKGKDRVEGMVITNSTEWDTITTQVTISDGDELVVFAYTQEEISNERSHWSRKPSQDE